MEENKNAAPVSEETPEAERDRELFEAIGRGQRKKRRRRIIILTVIVALVAAGLYAAVVFGRRKVNESFGGVDNMTTAVESYTVEIGNVNSTVTGSGLLKDTDTEALKVPDGVVIDEVIVSVGERVQEGDLLATVEPASVMTALSATQKKISELDAKLRSAANGAVSTYVTTNMPGRVKIVYAEPNEDVAACMIEHGALAVLSVDGYMAADIETDALTEGQEVKVIRAGSNKALKGKVARVSGGVATILVTDNGPKVDEEVTIQTAKGEEIGTAVLYIHNPLRITGYAGTISRVNCKENAYFNVGYSLFTLRDTAYSANYESLLRDRNRLEETLVQLLEIYRAGAVRAPFTGTVSSIEFKAAGEQTNNNADQTDDGSGENGTDGETTAKTDSTALLTLSRDERIEVTISVDEADILSVRPGQSAQITINSMGEVFTGEVSETTRSADGKAGVTSYTATISLPKDERMLPGMSVKVVVLIQGVEGTVLIPEKALQQTRTESYVYTALDPETGEPTEPKSVVAGLSNGAMVEIVEGLEPGDTVYYTVNVDPWGGWYYGTGGDADSEWVDTSTGDAAATEEVATDGNA